MQQLLRGRARRGDLVADDTAARSGEQHPDDALLGAVGLIERARDHFRGQ